MNINKSVNFDNYDEFIKLVQKLIKEKRSFNFNGNVDCSVQANTKSFSISWVSEEEI